MKEVGDLIQITKKLLDDYRKIKREIPLLEEELQELLHTDAGIGNSVIMDYRKGYPQPQSVTGFDWELYERRLTVLQSKKEKAAGVEEWIEHIEDVQTRYVFRLYYIEGMSWEKVAQKTGHSQSPDYPRLRIRDQFLKKSGVK